MSRLSLATAAYLLDLEIITFLSEKAWGQSDGPEPLSKILWYKKVHTNHKPKTKVKVNLRNATNSNSSSSNYYTTRRRILGTP